MSEARRIGRGAAAAAVAVLALLALLLAPVAASARTAEAAAAAPFGENAEAIRFTIERITPEVVTSTGPSTVTIAGRITNTTDLPLTELEYRFQRGDALTDAAAVSAELADPSQPDASVEVTFRSMGIDLPPGETARFAVSVPLARGTDGAGLGIEQTGVYPVMLNINATLPAASGIGRARAGELHVLLSVAGLPAAVAAASVANASAQPAQPVPTPIPVTTFAPFADGVHIGVGGVFLNDDLATDIRAGGRLASLLDQVTALPYPAAVDLVVDPMLLDELTAMAAGYRVVADVGVPQPALTPPQPDPGGAGTSATPSPPAVTSASDAAGSEAPTGAGTDTATAATAATGAATVPEPGTVAGTGGADAAAFLDRLRRLTDRHRVIALPYGNPDAVALTRADLQVSLRTSVKRGGDVARRVLGEDVVTDIAVPPGGVVDDATAAVLAEAGYRTLVLSAISVSTPVGTGTAVVTLPDEVGGGRLAALLADSPVLPAVTRVLAGERGDSTALALNALAADVVQRSFDGDTSPIAYLPAGDAAGYTGGATGTSRQLNSLLGLLARDDVVRPGDPTAVAASASTDATLDYSSSRADELPAEYLARWSSTAAEVSGVSASLHATAGADPALLVGQLRDAMRPLGSASLRADQQPGDLILATVDNSLDGLRGGVTIRSTAGSYTLASSSAPLVLTIRNDLPYDAGVRIVIKGAARAGLTVDDPGVILVPAGRNQQVPLPVTVSRSGTFSVDAVLIGADGTQWGEPVQLRIRSTAYGAITVVVIAVAGAALLLMVIWRIVQRIRQRGRGDGPDDADGPDSPDGPDGAGGGPDEPAPDSIIAAANHPPPGTASSAEPPTETAEPAGSAGSAEIANSGGRT